MSSRLRELMVTRDLSIRQLARGAGVGEGTVGNILQSVGDPTLGTMLALVDYFELASLEELMLPLGTTVVLRRRVQPHEKS